MRTAGGSAGPAKISSYVTAKAKVAIAAYLSAAKETPEIIKVPLISVQGNNGSLDSAAAVLGGTSNIAELLNTTKKLGNKNDNKK